MLFDFKSYINRQPNRYKFWTKKLSEYNVPILIYVFTDGQTDKQMEFDLYQVQGKSREVKEKLLLKIRVPNGWISSTKYVRRPHETLWFYEIEEYNREVNYI